MTRRAPSRTAGELLSILEAEVVSDIPSTPGMVNTQTAQRLSDGSEEERERLWARFTGGAADRHELSARVASRFLATLQDSVSSIGARLSGNMSVQGPLPGSILSATELLFSPTVLPGSVIFELSRRTGVEAMLPEHTDRPLLDESFDRLFELLSEIGRTTSDSIEVPSRIRDLGPRAAHHLFELSGVLVEEGLAVDLEWTNRRGIAKSAALTQAGAGYLKNVAQRNTSRSEALQLDGTLLTASVERSQKLRLRTVDGDMIPMTAPAVIRAGLASFYNKEVRVSASRTETINLTTGKVKVTFEMQDIEALE